MSQIDFPQWPKFFEDDFNSAKRILKNGKVNYWTGNEGRNFEKEFAKICNSKFAIALANGSLALTATYKALGLKNGDEFITTPRTFIATTTCAVLLGAKPIFADLDRDSGCITANTIEPLITKNTKLISVVHLGGWPADMLSICDLAKSYNITVVEDCSQAHGAKIKNKSVGSFGEIGTWSFCQEKILTTAGEGGMITTSNEKLWKSIWEYKDHGKSREKVIMNEKSSGFKWLHESIGNNFRMTEIQSAIGRNQLAKLSEWQKIRKRNALFLFNYLKDNKCLRSVLPPEGFEHAWYKYYTYLKLNLLKEDWSRDRIILEIRALGFPVFSGSCSEVYLEKCLQDKNLQPSNRLKVAKELGETSLMFLVHPTITIEVMEKYAGAIQLILDKAIK